MAGGYWAGEQARRAGAPLTCCVPLAGITYASYKKTPPPVPPRTTSKPLISVTAQSSTESTQDAYQDSHAQRMAAWPPDGRGLYNSTDSLDSNKAMSLALETAAAQRHASEGQGGATRTGDKAILASKAEEFLKSQRSSIGVQVPPRVHAPPPVTWTRSSWGPCRQPVSEPLLSGEASGTAVGRGPPGISRGSQQHGECGNRLL